MALVRQCGLRWRVIPGKISRDRLGSSPGDVVYDGHELTIEAQCPREWVIHEVAHFLVCRRNTPKRLAEPNWGFDRVERLHQKLYEEQATRRPHRKVSYWEEHTEALACDVTLGLLIRMRLPWHTASADLNTPTPEALDPSGKSERRFWLEARELCLERSRPFVEGLTFLS